MVKQIKISDRYEAAFINSLKAQGIEVPSPGIRVIQLDNPFIIEISDNNLLDKVKKALSDCDVLKKKISVNQLKEVVKKELKKYLGTKRK
jgi:hypothetical protein